MFLHARKDLRLLQGEIYLCVCVRNYLHRFPLESRKQEMVIAGLQPETAYSITVAAYTMKGDGARSKPKVVTTKGAGKSLFLNCWDSPVS